MLLRTHVDSPPGALIDRLIVSGAVLLLLPLLLMSNSPFSRNCVSFDPGDSEPSLTERAGLWLVGCFSEARCKAIYQTYRSSKADRYVQCRLCAMWCRYVGRHAGIM